MKVLLCERSFMGHRRIYMEWLSKIESMEFYCFAPSNFGVPEDHFFLFDKAQRSFKDYFWWIKKIAQIVKSERIDIVHFLDGDSIMRFMGIGLPLIKAKRIITTYHHFFSGFARKISYLAMNAAKGSISIAHTTAVKDSLLAAGVRDVRVCRYPSFTYESIAERKPFECREYFDLPEDVPVIGIVGGMADYKNIIPFLEVMQNCDQRFHIMLCGNGNETFIEQAKVVVAPYADNVTMNIRRLTDDEYEMAIMASDIVYCLYNHNFDGASGPLTDGVSANKMILSCGHGSLGSIVTQNHLGYTAECTDEEEILEKATKAVKQVKDFVYDDAANAYRESLMPEHFQKTYRKIYESASGEKR